ncbi:MULTISPECIES: hypothetical protein [unclassified Coleofasciculus]|uniref:hypothetical protein n=1 Tax=unclassified Coleofasciculus TaxID=2692782 RepID=UPI00187EAA45|nr:MULTISPECIES: hypothetical protein [unclassified Coleofasciculus]MBE9128098.1 hypothetical protein [Coleofasciculus sp. LEGE 07081]MBE9146971.1 hypothetical protein [Coleofasciculus sp. LEGE 07092]
MLHLVKLLKKLSEVLSRQAVCRALNLSCLVGTRAYKLATWIWRKLGKATSESLTLVTDKTNDY